MHGVRLVTICALLIALAGCDVWARWKRTQAEADLTHERAELLKAYRECLAEYKGRPELARQNCEHYTQALTVIDVRGVK